MLRIRPTVVTHSRTNYSIMSRAKKRAGLSNKSDGSTDPNQTAGIPRNLIKPKANAQLPPSRRQLINRETVDQSSSFNEWTTRGLAKQSALGEAMAKASLKKSIPLGAPSSSKVTMQLGPPQFSINPRQPAGKCFRYHFNQDMILMDILGLAERLVKVHKDVQQPSNPHLLRVAVMGAANAGKSTLVNGIVGEDVSLYQSTMNMTLNRCH